MDRNDRIVVDIIHIKYWICTIKLYSQSICCIRISHRGTRKSPEERNIIIKAWNVQSLHVYISAVILTVQPWITTFDSGQRFPATLEIGRRKPEIHSSSFFCRNSWSVRKMAGKFATGKTSGFGCNIYVSSCMKCDHMFWYYDSFLHRIFFKQK